MDAGRVSPIEVPSAADVTAEPGPDAAAGATVVPAGAPSTTNGSLPHPRALLEPPKLLLPVPGTEPRKRFRFRIDWELIACGLHGHELVGTDAATVGPEHAPFAREGDGIRWHRCLRCEAWVPLEVPVAPKRDRAPTVDELTLPIRGRRLRDRYVLRLIVIDRIIHIIVLGGIITAIFLFAAHKQWLHHTYLKVLNAIQGGVGGPAGAKHSGILNDIDHLFTLSTSTVYLIGVGVCIYTAILALEAIGLWNAKRWAEYLTLIETGVLIPFEIYELTGSVTPLKMLTLIINLAIVTYLLVGHRLFGLRGGVKAAIAAYGEQG